MDEDLKELLKTLKAAQDILQAEARDGEQPPKPAPRPADRRASQEGERKVSLGDVAKAHKDYEREPLDKK